MINIASLNKSFGTHKALNNISLTLQEGQVGALVGSSGSGKTTLMRCLCGLESPDSGIITFNNHEKLSSHQVGMVFQHFILFPHLTVLDNVTLALTVNSILKRKEAEEKGLHLLEKFGLKGKENYFPKNLSGGQKQRVAIVRALMMDPVIFLLDEPTSALDLENVRELTLLIDALKKENPKQTILLSTHELSFAKKVSQMIFFMDQGSLIEQTPTNVFFNTPQTQRAKQFLTDFF